MNSNKVESWNEDHCRITETTGNNNKCLNQKLVLRIFLKIFHRMLPLRKRGNENFLNQEKIII